MAAINLDDPLLGDALVIYEQVIQRPIGQDRSTAAVENAIRAKMPNLPDARIYELTHWAISLNRQTLPEAE